MAKDWISLKQLSARLKALGDLEGAIRCLKEAIALGGEANPLDVALMNNSLAALCLTQGESLSAEMYVRQAIEIESRYGDCGRETTNLANHYILLARILEKQTRYLEALAAVENSVSLVSALLGPDDDFVKAVMNYQKHLTDYRWKG